jgi:DNA repair photolyase
MKVAPVRGDLAVVDRYILGRFGGNFYRGCEHGCAYCEGRGERYHVQGDFARDIQVKRNALAQGELARMREPGFLFIGGVCDAYQPAEARYRLARGLLEWCRDRASRCTCSPSRLWSSAISTCLRPSAPRSAPCFASASP